MCDGWSRRSLCAGPKVVLAMYDYNATAPCSTADENVFGPQVRASCLGGFDFTLLFEESILTIAPLGIALLLLPLRVCALWKATEKVHASWLYVSKVVGASLLRAI